MPPPNDEVLKIQSEVFEDEIGKELSAEATRFADGTNQERGEPLDPSKKIMAFIIENSPIFRLFTENLTPPVREIWDRYAQGETGALQELEGHYDSFRAELESFIARLDPDAFSELANAIDAGDVDQASHIIEMNARMRSTEEFA